eukprot:CAMPEP_0184414322 /NCGR_PEP_ID=MMETSP0738-20130409/7924_1 /TAXON_ID=385413 /ORGANISM="Thalassiosira miniscula, Strain CCMP1093" /LENGTH=436 /DNA_ID=CAMNT_0026773299 /DNA_START=48 /DNA_END=1358 /DNA_ORIENTATION=+
MTTIFTEENPSTEPQPKELVEGTNSGDQESTQPSIVQESPSITSVATPERGSSTKTSESSGPLGNDSPTTKQQRLAAQQQSSLLNDSSAPTNKSLSDSNNILWDPVAATEAAASYQSSSSSSSKRKMDCNRTTLYIALAIVLLSVTIGLLASSLKKVPSTEMGVEYDIYTKQLEDATKSGGLFLGPPGFRFVKFPSTFITVNLNDRTCVSNDGLLVEFSVTFEYRMTEDNVLPAIIKYRDFSKWASMVESAGLSAIHHSCSDFTVSEFQGKRAVIQSTMEKNLRRKLEGDAETGEEGVHALAISLQLRFVELPEEYNTAVAEKQAAEEDIELARAQRLQETTKANTELLKAKEESRKILDTAENEADVLLTEAELAAEETLYNFQKEAEAIVEVKTKLNLTTEGVLAYLSNRLLSEATTLRVTTGEPAKLGRSDEL